MAIKKNWSGQNNSTQRMRTIPQRRSFKLQFPQSRKTLFLPRFWVCYVLIFMAFNCKCHRAGRLASRQVKGRWCNQCGQLNGHQKTRRELKIKLYGIRPKKKKELGANKKKFEIELFRIIYSGHWARGTGQRGEWFYTRNSVWILVRTDWIDALLAGIKNNWNGSENWQNEEWMTMPLMVEDLIWLKYLPTYRHRKLICLVN